MVGKVGVHDDDEVALGELQAMRIGGAEAELAFAGLKDDVGGVRLHELLCYVLCAVGRAIIDNDKFPVEIAGREEGRTPISLLRSQTRKERQASGLYGLIPSPTCTLTVRRMSFVSAK